MNRDWSWGRVAVETTRRMRKAPSRDRRSLWKAVVAELRPDRPSALTKSCAWGAFRGLCENGYVNGIPATVSPAENLNGGYAVRAARMLGENPRLAGESPMQLWRRVHGDISHNGQMHVVLALHDAGLLNETPNSPKSM